MGYWPIVRVTVTPEINNYEKLFPAVEHIEQRLKKKWLTSATPSEKRSDGRTEQNCKN